jgi:hypothetical protein
MEVANFFETYEQYSILHGVVYQNTEAFLSTATKTPNLA